MFRLIVHIFFLFFFFIGSTFLRGQNMSVEKRIKPAFKEYFGLPRASLFLHLNKSAFVQGESLWFKGYLFNRLKGLPLEESVNLYLGIYDSEGEQIMKKLIISKGGYSQGQIEIDSTLRKGQYYLKASTSWMRNFKEDDAFIQQFTVLGDEIVPERTPKKMKYDIQFLPEGGHLVTDVEGVLGIKAIDEKGKSIPFLSGSIRNQKGKEVGVFVTNKFGLAKVSITPSKGDLYKVFIKGETDIPQTTQIPKAKDAGLTLSLKTLPNGRIMILVGTNSETKEDIGGKPHSILIHRDGLLKKLDIMFPKDDLYVSHILEKAGMLDGMNIVTLVDGKGNPLAERLFFNFEGVTNQDINTSIKDVDKDSLSITISNGKKTSLSSLSISVLPIETKVYQNDFNIESAFLVKPYLKGHVENLRYYFEEYSRVKEAEFDLLLLTQGWSQYDWENIYENPPKKKYSFRTGIDVIGRLNKELPKKGKLLMYSGKNTNPQIISFVDSTLSFELDNYYLEKGEELKLTILNRRGSLEMPNLYLSTNSGLIEDKIYDLYSDGFDNLFHYKLNSFTIKDFVLPHKTIELEEVIVSDKRINRKITTPIIPERKLKKMTFRTEQIYPNLIDLIRANGFNVWEMPNTGYDRIRITTKRPLVFSLTQPSPILFIDDVRYSDFNILQDFRSTKIESYYIDRSGNGEGGGAGGVIRVYTRKEGEIGARSTSSSKKKPKFFTYEISDGFASVKKYYTPKYRSFVDDSFRNFGAIHWEPNLSLDDSGIGEFKIYNTGSKEMLLLIEGMHIDGTLVSTKKVLKIPEYN